MTKDYQGQYKQNFNDIKRKYNRMISHKLILLWVSMIILFCLTIYAICVGSVELNIIDVFNAVFKGISKGMPVEEIKKVNIIRLLRMPRILMAILAGAGLSVCGVIMQGITRNPLVSPYTIGISNAAAFGASLIIMFGDASGIEQETLRILCAFFTALLCAALVYGIAAFKNMKPITIVLIGIALTYLFSALTSTLQYLANVYQLEAIVRWIFGSMVGATWTQVCIMFILFLFCFPLFLLFAWNLNAMASGEDDIPKGLGINIAKVRIITGIMSVILTAGIISFTGVIGFIGIVGPHIARLIAGSDHRYLIPTSAVFGAILLLAADTAGRTLFDPINIPVGIVVAYIGVPIFVHLIITHKKETF
jgi:iron complex transport system permease protein